MDTITLPRKKIINTATSAVGTAILIAMLLFQNNILSAKDLGVGIYTGISPTLNELIENQKERERVFEKNIENKYFGGKIVEVEKGIKHVRMIRYYNNRPVRINVIELSKGVNHQIMIEPAIASEKLASRSKIANIAQKNNAIVAINGGYFKPQTGVPLGTLMIDKKVYTGPIYDRVAMGIFDEGYAMARVKLKAVVNTNIGGFKIDNINQPRMLSTHTIVYTRDWGEISPPSPKYGAQLVVENDRIVKFTQHSNCIPQNGYVIIGPQKSLEKFANAKKIKLDVKINPEWNDVKHVISGGPYLIKNNEIFVDMTAQKLTAIGGRNPRTAIGYTKDNHLIMLTADGREGSSIGLTLMELAYLMKELGCVNAMNLDGGGSTVMYVNGNIVNKPQEKGGIPLSHSLTVKIKES